MTSKLPLYAFTQVSSQYFRNLTTFHLFQFTVEIKCHRQFLTYAEINTLKNVRPLWALWLKIFQNSLIVIVIFFSGAVAALCDFCPYPCTHLLQNTGCFSFLFSLHHLPLAYDSNFQQDEAFTSGAPNQLRTTWGVIFATAWWIPVLCDVCKDVRVIVHFTTQFTLHSCTFSQFDL